MEKKIIGLLIVIIIGVVAISGCTSDDTLFENEYLSFKYPNTFTQKEGLIYADDTNESNSPVFNNINNENEVFYVTFKETNYTLEQEYENVHNEWAEETSENVTINGVKGIKLTTKYSGDTSPSFQIFVFFIHNEKLIAFQFDGNDLESLKSLYDKIMPTVKFK